MKHISHFLEKYKKADVLRVVCEITNKLGEHTAKMLVDGKTYIGQGFSNKEALENCFRAYFNSNKK